MSIDRALNSALADNPFAVLSVTTRDGREAILEAAEDRSLSHDPEKCQEARAVLTNPRRRLDAELGWLPGTAPGAAKRAASARSIAEVAELPLGGVARINALLSAGINAGALDKDKLRELLEAIATEAETITVEDVLRDINEDREVAGFPPFSSVDAALQALGDRRQEWRRAITAIMSVMPSLTMVEALYNLVEQLRNEGRFPQLLHEVIDDYALRAQPFIRSEIDAANKVIAKMRDLAPSRPDAFPPLMDALDTLLSTWEQLTRAIQISATLLGRTDDDSEELAFSIRGLSVDLFNEHGLIEASQRLASMVAANFQAIPRVADKVAEDVDHLDDLAEREEQRQAEIAYAADIGTFSKSRLAIDASSLQWKGDIYPVDSIRAVRWGAVRRSVNGVPSGTDYMIAWSDGRRTAQPEFRNAEIFEAFTDRIWKAVGNRIVSEIIATLRAGGTLQFGTALIGDTKVTIKRKKLFGEDNAEFSWADVKVHSADGSFIISGPDGSKTAGSMSYRDVNNVHFLEGIIRHAFQKGHLTLSDAFN